MATGKSAEAGPGPGAAAGWASIVIGTTFAAAWILEGVRLAAHISFETMAVGVLAYTAVIFGPLIAIAIACAWASRVSLARAGRRPGAWALAGFALGAAGFLATLGLSTLNGGLVAGAGSVTGAGLIGLGVLLTLFQTLSEELLFRGWLQPALSRQAGAVAGVVLTAVLFGAFHILGGTRGGLSIINLMLGGLWFGLLALRSGSILAPLAAHFAWNATEDLGFGLVPNPGIGDLGALWDRDLMGSPLWGGVEEGLNASIGTTVVLVALILPLLQGRRVAEPAAATA